MRNNKIVTVRYDSGESQIHMDAKDKIAKICLANNISLTNYFGEVCLINSSNIHKIKQEYTWYRKTNGIPQKSFSADVVLLDKNNKLLAIIEIVKTNGLSEKKYNFYQSLGIFWIELAAEHVLTEASDFITSFNYSNFHEYNVYTKNYLSEFDIETRNIKLTKKPNIKIKKEILENQLNQTNIKIRQLNLGAKKVWGIQLDEKTIKLKNTLFKEKKKLKKQLQKCGLSKKQQKLRYTQKKQSEIQRKNKKKIIKNNNLKKNTKTIQILNGKKLLVNSKQKTAPTIFGILHKFLRRKVKNKIYSVSINQIKQFIRTHLLEDEQYNQIKIFKKLETVGWRVDNLNLIYTRNNFIVIHR